MNTRALIYLRVYVVNQPDGGRETRRAVTAQLNACLDELTRIGAIMVEICCDFDQSGDDLDRPGLLDLFRRIDGPIPNVDLVVAISPDRLASTSRSLTTLEDQIENRGVRLHFVNSAVRSAA
jgi:DNA invertase Pin-like site-specific DNA recombinase